MSWLNPTANERTLLDFVKENQEAVYRLARVLGPALRIEPRLLRNARMKFLPHSDAGLEAALWRSQLVESSSRRAIILRGGVARLLTDSLSEAMFEASWALIEANTRHWPRLEQLEQKLRLEVVRGPGENQDWSRRLREALQLLAREDDESQRLDIARWAKHALPAMVPSKAVGEEADWLMKFAAAALGDPAQALGGVGAELPDWLGRLLPSEPLESATVGLRWRPGVLECLAEGEGDHDLSGLTPLPAPVRITAEGSGSGFAGWEALAPGGRLRVPNDARHLVLQTLLGERYRLSRRLETAGSGVSVEPRTPAWVLYAPGDEELAGLIADILRGGGVQAEIVDFEKALAMVGEAGSEAQGETAALVSLWSENTLRMMEWFGSVGAALFERGLVLVIDEATPPEAVAEGAVVDLRGWDRRPEGELSRELVSAVQGIGRPSGSRELLPMVEIPGGSFLMGSPENDSQAYSDEQPQHHVTVSSFLLSKTTVTRGQYREVMGTQPTEWQKDQSDAQLPANYVNWFDAVTFCNRLSEQAGLTLCYEIDKRRVTWNRQADGYRLPTEAEWEYACRAGTTTRWFWGDEAAGIEEYAWAGGQVHSVAEKKPNPWGLYDMAGNVREWCWDWYGGYSSDSQIDPIGPPDGTFRLLRGGAFVVPRDLRSACRGDGVGPEGRDWFIGFRVACSRRQP